LLDIKMPEMDGIELYRRLKEREPALSAIAITAHAEEEQITAAIREGILAMLFKPSYIKELLGLLHARAGQTNKQTNKQTR
jgi:CheY-like chemotaxis protein